MLGSEKKNFTSAAIFFVLIFTDLPVCVDRASSGKLLADLSLSLNRAAQNGYSA
jgi:hypothetical protein